MLRIEGSGRGIDAVAASVTVSDTIRIAGIIESIDDGAAILADRHEIHHGAVTRAVLAPGSSSTTW